jgi:hypothetical protein
MERERRGLPTALAVIAAAAIGFVIALVAFRGDDNASIVNATVDSTTTTTSATTSATTTTAPSGTTTTTTTATAAPTQNAPTVASCIGLWNQDNNRGARAFLANVAASQAIRVNVGESAQVPPKCLVTVIGNNGDVYTFAGAAGATYPYAPTPGRGVLADLPAKQRAQNALEQQGGGLNPYAP